MIEYMLYAICGYTQIINLLLEVLETLLHKTAFILALRLWKTKQNPDAEIVLALASVCRTWHREMTARPGFTRTLARRLSGSIFGLRI